MLKLKQVPAYLRKVFNIGKINSPAPAVLNPRSVITTTENDREHRTENYTRRPRKTSGQSQTISNPKTITTKSLEKMPGTTSSLTTPIVWMDLEMTGLDISKDVIMEVGCIITGPNLDEMARLPEMIINVPGTLLDSMDAWCTSTHGSSGLTEACRSSPLSNSEAEDKLLAFLQQHTEPGICPLGGNSITYDRIFLKKYMPRVLDHLHYRSIDVSTVKELVRRWYPKEFSECPEKRFIHKTIADLEDSISELKYYRSKVFKTTSE